VASGNDMTRGDRPHFPSGTVLGRNVEEHLVDPTVGGMLDAIEVPLPEVVHPEPRQMRTVEIVLAVIAGAAAIYVGLGVLTSVTAEIRIAAVLAGLGLWYLAFRGVGRRIAGPGFKSGLWLATGWLVLVLLCAVFVGVLPVSESRNPSKTLREPVLATPDLFSAHPLGTDRQGLDILGGIMYGLRVSAIVGIGAVVIGIILGGTIGTIAGYFRRAVDQIVELFTNAMLAFPPLVLLLGVAAVLDRNVRNTTLVLSVVSIPVYARLARATAMVLVQRDFVLAARAIGAKNRHIIIKDIVPGVIRPILAFAFVIVAAVIVAEASLSFLGLGIPRPEPTLGNMIAAGQSDFDVYPHLVFAPAIVLLITVLSLNQVGEVVQARWNPSHSKL
jgi:peptide/nickel transport system permease protein